MPLQIMYLAEIQQAFVLCGHIWMFNIFITFDAINENT